MSSEMWDLFHRCRVWRCTASGSTTSSCLAVGQGSFWWSTVHQLCWKAALPPPILSLSPPQGLLNGSGRCEEVKDKAPKSLYHTLVRCPGTIHSLLPGCCYPREFIMGCMESCQGFLSDRSCHPPPKFSGAGVRPQLSGEKFWGRLLNY